MRFTMKYAIKTSQTSRVNFTALIPQSIPNRQEIRSIAYSIQPSKIEDSQGNRYAEFVIENPPERLDLTITVDAQLYRYDLSTAIKTAANKALTETPEYVKKEQYLDIESPEVVQAASTIRDQDDMARFRAIFGYVMSCMSYRGYVSEDVGAAVAIDKAYGDCSDYSDVLVTICRAKGIPARTVDGYLMDYGSDTPRHTWTEVWLSGYGWVPFDPLLTDLGQVSIDRLHPNYLTVSHLRNDERLGNFHFYTTHYSGGSISISESYSVIDPDKLASTR